LTANAANLYFAVEAQVRVDRGSISFFRLSAFRKSK
jgi:hypothetical protein